MPCTIDDVLCVYADGEYYINVEEKLWAIVELQRVGFDRILSGMEPSIRYSASLLPTADDVKEVVYSESLGWRLAEEWEHGGTYPETTPQAPLRYVERFNSQDQRRAPSWWLTAFLQKMDPAATYPDDNKLFRRNVEDPKRVFYTPRAGYMVKVDEKYWRLKWWKIPDVGADLKGNYTAAGYVTYRTEPDSRALFVYDKRRGWMPAVFANGEVIIFDSLDTFLKFNACYSSKIEPLLVPSRKSLVDQVIERRFSKTDAVAWHIVGPSPKILGHQVYWVTESRGYFDVTKKYYYFKNEKYWPLDLEEANHDGGAFASRDLTHHGHFEYNYEGQKRLLYVVFSKTEGLLPSVLNNEKALDGMRNPSAASNTSASVVLSELAHTFSSGRSYGAEGQQQGQDGSLYYDLLDGRSDLLMFLGGRYWPFQWRTHSEGVLGASFRDGSHYDVILRLDDEHWALKWEGESAPSWFAECLRIVMAHGDVGVRVIREAEERWVDPVLRDPTETMELFSACLSRLEAEYRSSGKSEKWRSVMILIAQLFAFFAREVRSGELLLEFSPEVLGQLSRMVMQDDFAESIEDSIMDDASESTNSINAIEDIDAELERINDQKSMILTAIEGTTAIKNNADKVFYTDTLYVLGGKPSVRKIPAFFKLVLDWLLKWNDLTHDWYWAEEYLAWLKEQQARLDDKKKLLRDRRDKLGSPTLYKRIFDAYQAGIVKGKNFEEKYAFPIDWATDDYAINQRMLWAQYSGALAELALDAQRGGKAGVPKDTASAETESARYYLWLRFSEASRFQELISAVGSRIESKRIIPKGRYTDLTDCIHAAAEIVYEEDPNRIELVTTDLAFLAMSIYAISTTSQSVRTMRGNGYEDLRATFLERSRSLHPFAFLPDKPAPYLSMAEIRPSSQFGSGDERYEGYLKQFDEYRATSLSYDAGVMVKTGLENVQLRFERMYDITAIVNLDIYHVGATARVHFIQLSDDSCLFYMFVKDPTVTELSSKAKDKAVKEVKNWYTGMEWLPETPGSSDVVKDYSAALTAFLPYILDALSDLTIVPGGPNIYFGTVRTIVVNVAPKVRMDLRLFTTTAKISPPADAFISSELVPYLLKENEKDLNAVVDQLYSSMLELSPRDKWIGFFVVFYSEIRKSDLDQNYKIDPFSILVDATTVMFAGVPWLRSSAKIVKDLHLVKKWKLGVHTGLRGRKLIAHTASQIPLKSIGKLGLEFLTLIYELFFPFTFPLNPFTLDFRGLIFKHKWPIARRPVLEWFSDTRSLKGFLQNAVLPPSIVTLEKMPVKPREGLQRVGPFLYRSELTYGGNEQARAVYYIKVGEFYYAINWDTNLDLATQDNSSAPLASYFRRRFADWVQSTSPGTGVGAVSPTWTGAGLNRTSPEARIMVTDLRVAKRDALDVLRGARRVATSESEDIQAKVKRVFEIFWGDASQTTIRSFANNLSNIIEFLSEISVSVDVAFLGDSKGSRLSAMPGSAFDIAQTYDSAAGINRRDVNAEHNQRADAITGPGFIKEPEDSGTFQYATRNDVIPLAMRPDNFFSSNYTFDVTARLVRMNEFCRSVIREGFIATTRNMRVVQKWGELMTAAKDSLPKLFTEERQLFFDQLSLTYNLFVFEGQPLEARPLAAFVNAGARGWDITGDEVGVDISSLLQAQRTPARGESATAARAADPDLFSFLVIVLNDINADPPRFEDFTTRVAQSKPGEQLLWKWYKKDPSA